MKIVSKTFLPNSFVRHDLSVRHHHNFVASGAVVHNCNSRYVYLDGVMYCGSRTEWKKEFPTYDHLQVETLAEKVGQERAQEIVDRLKNSPQVKNLWWQALEKHPEIREFCERNPGMVVYAECYGAVQDLNYGHKKGEVSLACFDIRHENRFLNFAETEELRKQYGLPWAPLVGVIPFNFERVCELAEGKSLVPGANHLREGVVVRPLVERLKPRLGRVCLKWVSAAYLERSKSHSDFGAPEDE